MKKTFKIEELCCPNCAQKMEDGINKLDGVTAAITFMTKKLTFEAPDDVFEARLDEAEKIMKKIESDVEIVR